MLPSASQMLNVISTGLIAHSERIHRLDVSLVPTVLVMFSLQFCVLRVGCEFGLSVHVNVDAFAWALSGSLGCILMACALALLIFVCIYRSPAVLLLFPIAAPVAYRLHSWLAELLLHVLGPQCESHRSSTEEDYAAGRYAACKTLWWTASDVAFPDKPHLIRCCAMSLPAVIGLHVQASIITATWFVYMLIPWRNRFVAAIRIILWAEWFVLDEFFQFVLRIIKVLPSVFLTRFRKRQRSRLAVQIAATKLVEDVAASIWQFLETDALVRLLPYETAASGTSAWQLAFHRVLRNRLPFRVRVGYVACFEIPGSYFCEVFAGGHEIASFDDPRGLELSPLFALVSELDLRIPRSTHKRCIDWQQFDVLFRLPALRSLTLAMSWALPLNSVQQLLLSAGGSTTASSLLLNSDEFSRRLEPLLPRLTAFKICNDDVREEMRIAASVPRMECLQTLKTCFPRFDLIFPSNRLSPASIRTLANLRVLQLAEYDCVGRNASTVGIALIAQHCPLLTELSINFDEPQPATQQPSTTAYFNAFRSLRELRVLHLLIARGHELVLSGNIAPITSVRTLRVQAKGYPLSGHKLRALVATFSSVVSVDIELSHYDHTSMSCLSSIARGEVCASVRDLALRSGFPGLSAGRFSSPDFEARLIALLDCPGKLDLSEAHSPTFFENVTSLHAVIELAQRSRTLSIVIPGALKASELQTCMAVPNVRFSWAEPTPQRRRSTSPKTHEAWLRSFDAVTNFRLAGTKTSGAIAGKPFSVLVCGSSDYLPSTDGLQA